MKQNYITAVLQKLQAGDDPVMVIEGLKKTLANRGHDRLFGSVLNGVARVLQSASTDTTTITVVNEEAYDAQKAAIDTALSDLKAEENHKVVLDKTIVGGFIAETNNIRLDKSYKSKLVTLYRSLTK